MMELLLVIGVFFAVLLWCFYTYNQVEKLRREGRQIVATVEYIRPISTDESGNTTVVYVLNFEGRTLEGNRKIDTFYAPQLQPGMKINIIYKDDKNYIFDFNKQNR